MNKKGKIERKTYLKDKVFLKELGEQVRKCRKAQGITQEYLANTINVEISQISRLERGILNASISMLKDIAIALNLDLKDLFDFEYTQQITDFQ